MKKPIIIVLFCLACGLFSCTQTDSSVTTKELTPDEIAEEIHTISRSGLRGNSETLMKKYIKEPTPNEIAEEIHTFSRSGLGDNSETLMKCLEKINADNVLSVLSSYERSYGKSIFNEIMSNVFISSKTRANAVKHIKNTLMQVLKSKGVYTDDYDKLIEGHIDYEQKKFGRMKSKDIDEDLRCLCERYIQTTRRENTLFPANGKIDEGFYQGYVGDCWLLSAIKSLSVNPKGLEMLNDLISLDDKGNVTVQLKGVNRVYTILKNELEGANEFAQGDLDIRAIELAVNKYLHEFADHGGKSNDANINCYDIHEGNSLDTPYRILFDKQATIVTVSNKETIEKIKSGEYSTTILSSSTNDYQPPRGYFKRHIYAVIGADDNYVYISAPHCPGSSSAMTHDEFLKFFDLSYSMQY